MEQTADHDNGYSFWSSAWTWLCVVAILSSSFRYFYENGPRGDLIAVVIPSILGGAVGVLLMAWLISRIAKPENKSWTAAVTLVVVELLVWIGSTA